MASSNLNIRIDADVKAAAQDLFSQLGMDLSTAVNIFIRQAIDFGGIPFTIQQRRYNAETEAAIQEGKDILAGKIPAKRYSSFDEFLKELDEETEDEC
ncbi:MAG: type II toxin-antitoxin system RelB/DinJ family antitoxin [Prevotella sp.]|nr:type II toxin-antitoxin system RelB/DinJ family antitoxin [Prevotella sp.]